MPVVPSCAVYHAQVQGKFHLNQFAWLVIPSQRGQWLSLTAIKPGFYA